MLERPTESDTALPPELMQAIEANNELREALQNSGMPTRFQAMTLGLATLRQVNPKRRTES